MCRGRLYLCCKVGVGVGGHACHDITQLQLVVDGAGRADRWMIYFPRQRSCKVHIVNADGGNVHAAFAMTDGYAFRKAVLV